MVAIILFIFIKSFQIKLDGAVILHFSLLDEFKRSVNNVSSGGISAVYEIYSIIAFVMILSGAVMAIADLVKNIFNITNLERYALTQYDNIKRRGDDKGKKKYRGQYSVIGMFYSGIIFEIMGIFMTKYLWIYWRRRRLKEY